MLRWIRGGRGKAVYMAGRWGPELGWDRYVWGCRCWCADVDICMASLRSDVRGMGFAMHCGFQLQGCVYTARTQHTVQASHKRQQRNKTVVKRHTRPIESISHDSTLSDQPITNHSPCIDLHLRTHRRSAPLQPPPPAPRMQEHCPARPSALPPGLLVASAHRQTLYPLPHPENSLTSKRTQVRKSPQSVAAPHTVSH